MSNRKETPFMKIPDACRVTGLSQYYLRNGCKDGTIPHIKSGRVYFITSLSCWNSSAWLDSKKRVLTRQGKDSRQL